LKYCIFILFIIFSAFIFPLNICARPWWWSQFSAANHKDDYSCFEKWHSYFIDSASPEDTVYVQSMAWDDENVGTINWISGDNSIGLNRLVEQSGRTAPLRIIGDYNYNISKWNHIRAIADPLVEMNGSNKTYLTHSKICYVANKGVIISSANHNRNGWNYEHNNSIILFRDEFPDLLKKIEKEQTDEFNRIFHSQTTTGNIYHFSPYGDTVEIRFSPDDNNNGMESGAESIVGRLRYLIENAKESIIYMANAWGSSNSDPEANAGNKIKDSIINNSTAFKIGAKGAYSAGPVQSALQNNHTCRIESPMNDQHSKIFIIDLDILCAGSANFSSQAMLKSNQNDEAHIIIHDFRIARRYMSHFHHIMSGLDPENTGDADNYDNTPPDKPSNLSVTASLNSFELNWTKPELNISDFSRYYIFIDSKPINSNYNIGDKIDNDGDGYFDEDPTGNIDRFSSSFTGSGIPEDDDADGKTDEDPWLFPEMQIKNINQTNAVLTTSNVGDQILNGVSYWFAVVAVDTQGNESLCDTSGPHRLSVSGDTSLIITEIFYDNGSEKDWLEIYNNGISDVDFNGWKILDGENPINFSSVYHNVNGVGSKIIKPGQYAVASPSAEQWYDFYGDTPPILFDFNVFDFNLSSQNIGLITASGATVVSFVYPDKATTGHSIELFSLYSDPSSEAEWQASNEFLSKTPGDSNTTISSYNGADTNIKITEIMFDVPPGFSEDTGEWIEFFNCGSETVNLTGWKFGVLSGSSWIKSKFIAVSGDLYIGPGEYAVFHENGNAWNYGDVPSILIKGSSSFSMRATGDAIALLNSKDSPVEIISYPLITSNNSIERKNFRLDDYSELNWEPSNFTNGETHTAGKINTTALPEISIQSPENMYDTINQTLIISGTTLNSWKGDTVSIYLNGNLSSEIIIEQPNGSWSDECIMQSPGDSVCAVLNEQFGKSASDTIAINYFHPLELSLDLIFTEYDSMIKPLYFDIKTIGTDFGDTLIIFNEIANSTETITLTKRDGSYYDTIVLSDYGDTVWSFVYDKFGRNCYDTITVNYHPELLIQIQTPSNFHDTFLNQISVSGTTLGTDRGGTVTVFTNAETQSFYIIQELDGSFNSTALLSGNLSDSIIVKLEDRFGRTAYDSISVNYFPEHSLKISYPNSGIDTNSKIITIKGTSNFSFPGDAVVLSASTFLGVLEDIEGNNSPEFLYDYAVQSVIPIAASDSLWQGTVSLSNQNDSVIATLIDRFGRTYYDTLQINYFGNSSIGIIFPWAKYDTNSQFVNVSGSSYNSRSGDTINIFVNEIFQSSFSIDANNGEWNGTANLISANDSITAFIVSDWCGTSADTVEAHYFTTISFGISNPAYNTDTNIKSILISGTSSGVAGPDKIEIFLNGDYSNRQDAYYIWEENENWSVNSQINNIGDRITAKLTDQFGRILWDTITLNYYPPASIVFCSPAPYSETTSQSISISGTTYNSNAGDSIFIFQNGNLIDAIFISQPNDSWASSIILNDSLNVITLKLFDKFNEFRWDTLTISYFPIPNIKILSPLNNSNTNVLIISVSGSAQNISDGDSVEIFINSIFNSAGSISNFQWNGTGLISALSDSILVKLTDKFGRIAYDTITIKLSEISVAILNPVSSGLTYETTALFVSIAGTTNNLISNDTLNLLINDSLYISQSASSTWNCSVPLSIYSETINVTIIDGFGRTAIDTIFLSPGLTASGYISLEGNNNDSSNAMITIYNETESFSTFSDSSGFFVARFLYSDSFILTVSKPLYKSFVSNFYLYPEYVCEPVILYAGDFFRDGVINIRDAAMIKKHFGKIFPDLDIDGNSMIGNEEKYFLKKNYFK